MSDKKWLVVYTQPRWEKKVHALMVSKGLDSYCPINTVYKQWSDRVKKVEEPLFKSYVFVNVAEEERSSVRMVNGVLNFVYWLGKPAVIKTSEIDTIRRFLNEYDDVEVQPLEDIRPGSKLIINNGILISQEATALKVGKKIIEVQIETLGCKLIAKMERGNLSLKK